MISRKEGNGHQCPFPFLKRDLQPARIFRPFAAYIRHMKRSLWAVALAGFALALPLVGVSPAPPSATAFYARAIEQMRHHPDPPFAMYDASISGLNCNVAGAGIECTLGRSTAASEKPFPVALRQRDGRVAINPQNKQIVLGDSTFLNPTWPGVDAIIRRGFMGMGGTASTPAQTQSSSTLPVIAVVSAFSVEDYNVYDAGAATCATGDSGHAVRLVARRDPLRYPLTGATVDLKTGDLCALRFNAKINGAAGLVGATGGAELDLESVAGYDVVANERFSIDLRAIGVAVKHLNIDVAYSDFAFPKTIDPGVFVTPAPSPGK